MLEATFDDRVVDLVEEGYDLAMRITSPADSQLVSRRLSTAWVVLCALPAYLAAHDPPTHPHESGRYRIIEYSYRLAATTGRLGEHDGEFSARVNARIRTNTGDICVADALKHKGILLQPGFIAGPDAERDMLFELLPAHCVQEIDIHAVHEAREHLPSKTRRLADFLVAAFEARAGGRRGTCAINAP